MLATAIIGKFNGQFHFMIVVLTAYTKKTSESVFKSK